MQEEIKRYSDRLRIETSLPLAIRVGLNSGEMVVRDEWDDLKKTVERAYGKPLVWWRKITCRECPSRAEVASTVTCLRSPSRALRDVRIFWARCLGV